jgi:ubiquinone/menaquinone biosynthesis C-methylase UbiE
MTTVEHDEIADVYDETRRALDADTLNGTKEMLAAHDCRSILEIGVGTGRVSLPLYKNGYEMTAVDISRKMMARAKVKGLKSLILANGSQLPFRDKSFDATLMAHVFHLLENPISVMREAARVSRVEIFALVRKRTGSGPWFYGGSPSDDLSEEAIKQFEDRRKRFRQIAEKYGWNWDSSLRFWNDPLDREQEILETNPPDELKLVSDVTVNESVEARIARFEKGGHTFAMNMPEEMRKEIIKEMRSNPSEWMSQPRREIYQIVLWKSETLKM